MVTGSYNGYKNFISKLVIIWSLVTIGYLLISKGSDHGYNVVTILVTSNYRGHFAYFWLESGDYVNQHSQTWSLLTTKYQCKNVKEKSWS